MPMQKFYHKYLDHLSSIYNVSTLITRREREIEQWTQKFVPYKLVRLFKFANSDLAYAGMTVQELEEEIDKLWALYRKDKNEIKTKPELY